MGQNFSTIGNISGGITMIISPVLPWAKAANSHGDDTT